MLKSILLTLSLILSASGVFAAKASDADFSARAHAPGVIRFESFDNWKNVKPYYEPAWDGSRQATIDTKVKASGTGSLRFTVPSFSEANSSGSFAINLADDLSTQIGEGEEIFVQWRQRFSKSFLTFQGEGWKQAIIGEGDRPNNYAPGCSELEVVLLNEYQRGIPQGYHSCWNWDELQEPYGTDFKLQNAMPAPYCLYSDFSGDTVNNCFWYKADQWMTFQMHIKVGHWNEQDSLIEVWAAEQGMPSIKIISMDNFLLHQSQGPEVKYGKVHLTPYHSGKDVALEHPVAYTWYDELIISRNPIQDPANH